MPHSEISQVPAVLTAKPDVDARETARQKAASLTLEEQVRLLRAADFWRTVAIPEKGIPAIKTTDGPNGARGAIFRAGTKAALFPCGVSLAATWNTDLIHKVGQHLGEEAKARSAHVLLAPTVCMHRSPLGGRNFESFSEDPYLAGKLAAYYINGVQEKHVAATIKHFVANEQETLRLTMDSQVDERALREIYLRPFEIAIREANPWAVMSSYNLVNGVHADMNNHTLKEILRGEWGYDGLVMSDWTGINSIAESVIAGCDLEMPFSDKWRGEKLIQAVKDSKLSAEDVEKSAANILYLITRTTGYDMTPEAPEREADTEERRAIIRQAGIEGLTLLKNEGGILPIQPSAKKIAIIGPNARRAIVCGGGSSSLNPYYTTSPFDSISSIPDKQFVYARGAKVDRWLPLASNFCTTSNGQSGLSLDWYGNDRFSGEVTVSEVRPNTDLVLFDSVPKVVGPGVGFGWSLRVKTKLLPVSSGTHSLAFSSVGPGRLFIDGKLTIDNWDWTDQGEAMFDLSKEVEIKVLCTAGKALDIVIETTNELRPLALQGPGKPKYMHGGLRLGYEEEDRTDYLAEAVEVAKVADVAVVIVGLDAEWEAEGADRRTMDLPKNGSQDALISAVAAANPRTIVVNQSGTPITMPWVHDVPAILQAWYQGQEAGNALKDVLFGKASPSGKLPCTFPVKLSDNPSYHNWGGENLKVIYGEGIYIGYRHYDLVVPPLFPFGHGLSYTTFNYGVPSLSSGVLGSQDKETITLSLPITNTGSVFGSEIIQAYIHDPVSRLRRPVKELVAFSKVFLQPGETRMVALSLDKYSVGYYDTAISAWIAEEGTFEVRVGASCADIRQSASFEVKKSFTWIF